MKKYNEVDDVEYFDLKERWVCLKGKRGNDEQTDFNCVFSIDDVILLQYTGLKDKNGKEVYEGDIISGDDGSKEQVFWGEERGQWMIDGKDVPYDELHFHSQHMEVISNIYESPELLLKQYAYTTRRR